VHKSNDCSLKEPIMSITGRFELVSSENFDEYLKAAGKETFGYILLLIVDTVLVSKSHFG